MAELKNTFSWSFSASGDFDECRRKRYWSKYGMWGGWNRDATEEQKKAYQLNKMGNRFTLQGQAAERAVMWVLRQKQAGCDVTAEDAYQQIARPFLNDAWKASRDGLWRSSPKKYFCLREHYYQEIEPESSHAFAAGIMDTTKRCIANFIDKVLPKLAHVTPEMEVPIATVEQGGDPESFTVEDVKVYAIPDYVYVEDGIWHIHDWKSGRQKDAHADQLAVYGLWAHRKHGVPPGKILIYIQYLAEGITTVSPLTRDDLDRLLLKIEGSVAEMTEYLIDFDRVANKPLPKDQWDLALDRRTCRFCNFFELCRSELEREG